MAAAAQLACVGSAYKARAMPGLNNYQVKISEFSKWCLFFKGISGWGLKAIVKFIEQEQLKIVVMIHLWPILATQQNLLHRGQPGTELIRSKKSPFLVRYIREKTSDSFATNDFFLKSQP